VGRGGRGEREGERGVPAERPCLMALPAHDLTRAGAWEGPLVALQCREGGKGEQGRVSYVVSREGKGVPGASLGAGCGWCSEGTPWECSARGAPRACLRAEAEGEGLPPRAHAAPPGPGPWARPPPPPAESALSQRRRALTQRPSGDVSAGGPGRVR